MSKPRVLSVVSALSSAGTERGERSHETQRTMKPALTLLAALLLAPLAALPAADDTLFMNEDAWHYFTAAPDVKRGHGDEDIPAMRPEFTLTKQGLEHYIDEIARGHVTHFVMNLNSQRANFPLENARAPVEITRRAGARPP